MAGIPRALKFDFELVLRRLAVTRDSLNDFHPQPPNVWIGFCFPIQLYRVTTGFGIYSFNPNRLRSIPIWTEFIFVSSRRDQFPRLPWIEDATCLIVRGAGWATKSPWGTYPADRFRGHC